MRIMRDLYSHKFGRLVALYPMTRRAKSKQVIWMCRCDCGNLIEVLSDNLSKGNTKSCGCLKKEIDKQINITHGDTANGKMPRIYVIWTSMKARCSSPKIHNYKSYGGRGISVCNEWRDNYVAFRDWAMANGYANNLTIDRIDSAGNYTPDNCQWLTNSDNAKKAYKERRVKNEQHRQRTY